MTAIRIIPKSDEAAFPYEQAKQILLIEDSDCVFEPVDFEAMIAAGRRFGWTPEMIRANEELAQRGNCFNFRIERPPFLRGTLFENNIMFGFTSQEHEDSCLPMIQDLARRLDAGIFRH